MITFSITDLAKEFEVSTRAIRFYEDQGLLAPKRDGRNRVFSKRDRVRLELILRSKRLGFSLVEIRELFDLYDSAQGDKAQLRLFLKVLSSKRVRLGEMKKDIEAMLSDIDMFEGQNKRILEKQVHPKESV
jgi:DNA-binding transcriptional MerR regulator